MGTDKGASALLTTEDPATTPYPSHGTHEAVAPVGSHGRLGHFQRLRSKMSIRKCREKESDWQFTCPSDVTLNNE